MMLAELLSGGSEMASTPTPPKLRAHHGYRSWTSRWYDDQGERHDKRFGKEGEVSERQAKAAYRTWLREWTLNDRVKNPNATAATYTIAELARDYLEHAKRTFVKHGRMTSTVWNVAYAMQALLDHYGPRIASELEGPDIAALRDAMIHGTDAGGKKYARAVSTVNDRLFIVKQAFMWAREQGLVGKENLFDIAHVKPLQAGRCAAKPPKEIRPVDEHWVSIAKDHAPSAIGAMVDLQWLTGMRPGDVCLMRPLDIDTTGEVWLYRPHEHKMEHKGRARIIPLGPQCQRILSPFLKAGRKTDRYLFSPAEAHAERLEKKRAARKTPRWSTYAARLSDNPVRGMGGRYSEAGYRRAIHHACDAADTAARRQAVKRGETIEPGARLVPRWNPNQLRHAAATRLNKMFGLEDVSVMLGHDDIATTRIYAEPAIEKAVEIAKRVG